VDDKYGRYIDKSCKLLLILVRIVAFDRNIAQTAELQGKGAGAGKGAQQGEDAQQPDPVFIDNSGYDNAERDDHPDPFGCLVGVAFLCLAHTGIIAQGDRFFN